VFTAWPITALLGVWHLAPAGWGNTLWEACLGGAIPAATLLARRGRKQREWRETRGRMGVSADELPLRARPRSEWPCLAETAALRQELEDLRAGIRSVHAAAGMPEPLPAEPGHLYLVQDGEGETA